MSPQTTPKLADMQTTRGLADTARRHDDSQPTSTARLKRYLAC